MTSHPIPVLVLHVMAELRLLPESLTILLLSMLPETPISRIYFPSFSCLFFPADVLPGKKSSPSTHLKQPVTQLIHTDTASWVSARRETLPIFTRLTVHLLD